MFAASVSIDWYPSRNLPADSSYQAIAANTIMRSLFGAVFPLFGYYMFEGMGINYAMTLLGAVAALFVPMPFVFYFYGKKIRAKSKFAPAPDLAQDKRRRMDEEARAGLSNDENGTGANGNAGTGSESTSAGEAEKKEA